MLINRKALTGSFREHSRGAKRALSPRWRVRLALSRRHSALPTPPSRRGLPGAVITTIPLITRDATFFAQPICLNES
jgi:hypothetical protein